MATIVGFTFLFLPRGRAAAGPPVGSTQWTMAWPEWARLRRLRHGPLTFGVREGRPNESPETTQRRPVAQRKCASGGTLSLLSHVPAALRSLRAPHSLDPSSGTSGPSAAGFCFLFLLTGTRMHAPKRLTLPRDSRFPPGQGVMFLNTTHSLRWPQCISLCQSVRLDLPRAAQERGGQGAMKDKSRNAKP